VFIDEIDAAGRRRGGLSGGQEERDQTLNQLLVEMDGFETTAGIVVIGATNRPDILDPALLRPGRFDRQITVTPPDVRGRQEILELHARNRPVSPQVDWEHLARRTPGFTGADLANVINEAALLGVRAGSEEIGTEQLEEAVLRVLVGPQRRGTLLTGEERRRIAFHESGHALVAAAVGHLDDVQRLSIVARGKALGQSMSSKRWQERAVLTRSELRTELLISMAGAAAEDLILGEPSTGAADDVDRATELAELMVGRFGMSERLGKVRMVRSEGSEFLGSQTVPADLTAGPVLMELHQEVRRLIDDAEMGAREVLTRHRKLLVTLAEQLEEAETLESAEIAALLDSVRPEMNVILDDSSQPVSPNGHTAGAVARGAQGL
jgi:cell division protease FtsH